MKTIVILTCPKSEDVCTGAGCFRAFNERKQQFERYGDEPLQMAAYMKCSGCGHFMENDAGLREKMETILRLRPDALHLGVCCCHNGRTRELCKEIEALAQVFEAYGIAVARGTHSKF